MNAVVLGALAIGALVFLLGEKIADQVEVIMPSWTKYDDLFKKYGTKYNVPWQWLKAIALNESSLGAAKSVAHGEIYPNDIDASKSSDGKSWGLMQVTLKTAKALDPGATEVKLNNAEYSIDLAARLIQSDSKQFAKIDARYTEWVIKSYNQGAGNTKKEMNGWRGPWSDHVQQYWERFQRNLKKVEENA